MGWFSNVWKKVKNVFKKVTKVVKKVVKSVGKTAKKVWNGVKSTAQKFAKGMSKLGPFANIAMNFIPGFGQLWQAYGIWGQLAKGAITGFALSGGSIKGALLGAASAGAADIFKSMPGKGIAGKVGEWWDSWKNDSAIGKAVGKAVTDFKDAFKPSGPTVRPAYAPGTPYEVAAYGGPRGPGWKFGDTYTPFDYQDWSQTQMEKEAYGGPREKGWTFAEGNPSWIDKLRQGTRAYSDSLLNQQPQSSLALAYNPYDTSKMTGYNTQAGDTQGQIAGGQDTFDVNKIGLLTALQRMQESEGVFLKPNYNS